MTRHCHEIGGGADLVLPAAAARGRAVFVWLTKTYVTRFIDLKYLSMARTTDVSPRRRRRPRTLELTIFYFPPCSRSDARPTLVSIT